MLRHNMNTYLEEVRAAEHEEHDERICNLKHELNTAHTALTTGTYGLPIQSSSSAPLCASTNARKTNRRKLGSNGTLPKSTVLERNKSRNAKMSSREALTRNGTRCESRLSADHSPIHHDRCEC